MVLVTGEVTSVIIYGVTGPSSHDRSSLSSMSRFSASLPEWSCKRLWLSAPLNHLLRVGACSGPPKKIFPGKYNLICPCADGGNGEIGGEQ